MTETVRAFARGLEVLRAFGAERPAMTVADVARATELNRATARRLLHTLAEQGYASHDGETFRLTPRVLELGYAFVSSFGLPELAMPILERLSADLNEASSLGLLDATDVVYVARVPARRIMNASIGLGTRFPAYRTSLGRTLLAWHTDAELRAIWERSDRSEATPRTVTDLDVLTNRLAEVRTAGVALVDQELELGVRSVAAPIRDASGAVIAAMNVSTHVTRTSLPTLWSRYVPPLRASAAELEQVLATQLHRSGRAPGRPER